MLGVIRRKLRQLRYYSAPRRRDRRTIIFERTALIALVLCVPVTFIIDRNIHRSTGTIVIEGRLVVDNQGVYHASLVTNENEMDAIWYRGEPVADFDITLNIWNYGWPITTSRSRAPAKATFMPFDQNAYIGAALAGDPGVRDAVDQIMRDQGPHLGSVPFDAAPFSWDEGRRSHSPIGWIYATFIWFVMLMALIIGPMLLLEFYLRVSRVAREVRSLARKQRGQCIKCGYDLTGLEFNERCPECGELVA